MQNCLGELLILQCQTVSMNMFKQLLKDLNLESKEAVDSKIESTDMVNK
jgi:hypothetical protein